MILTNSCRLGAIHLDGPPLRIGFSGARHHVMAGGNQLRKILVDDADRRLFHTILAELQERFGIVVDAWVLMDNHHHRLLQTAEANFSEPLSRSL